MIDYDDDGNADSGISDNDDFIQCITVFRDVTRNLRLGAEAHKRTGGSRSLERGGHMASAEREPIMGVWSFAPSGVQRQSPGQGVRGRS